MKIIAPPIDHELLFKLHPELAVLPVCNNYKADNVETVEAEENSFCTIVDVNGIEQQVEASQLRACKALLGNFNGMLFGYKKHVESLRHGPRKEVAEYIMSLPDYNVRYR